jgi:hypothetical protein
VLEWEGGRLEVPIRGEAGAAGDTLRLLRGARLITDLESRMQTAPQAGLRVKREQDRLERHLEELSRHYGLASRAMALVAVVDRAGDRPGAPPETRVVPVGLPQDMVLDGIFDRASHERAAVAAPAAMVTRARFRLASMVDSATSLFTGPESRAQHVDHDVADPLMDLAALLEPDGGMPGQDETERILKTLLALLAFAAEGHSASSGPFRAHMRRMLEFTESRLPGPLAPGKAEAGRRIIEAIRSGRRPDPTEHLLLA